MRGRKPKPTALKILEGNPGKRAINGAEPRPPPDLPSCPAHLSAPAKTEWRRLAGVLHRLGLLSAPDRAALAAYCQAWGRWVEAETWLQETPVMLRTPSGYVQPSPWLAVANKNLELMQKYMAELGMTSASRSRVTVQDRLRPNPWEVDDDDLARKYFS